MELTPARSNAPIVQWSQMFVGELEFLWYTFCERNNKIYEIIFI